MESAMDELCGFEEESDLDVGFCLFDDYLPKSMSIFIEAITYIVTVASTIIECIPWTLNLLKELNIGDFVA